MEVGLPFVVQPLAFPDLDVFTTKRSTAQQAAIYGRALDQGYNRYVAADPALNPQYRSLAYFDPSQREFLQGPSKPPGALKISINGLASYQLNNKIDTPHDDYMQTIINNGGVGKEKAQYIMTLVKAAMVIASRASESQLDREGVPAGKNPGMLKNGFPRVVQDSDAAIMVGALGKFIEPQLLRESLLEYRSGFPGALHGTQMGQMLLNDMSPGKNIAQEVAAVSDLTTGDALQRKTMAEKIRFQRAMPHYSVLGSTTQHIIRKVKTQQTMLGKYKPRPSGRFLFND